MTQRRSMARAVPVGELTPVQAAKRAAERKARRVKKTAAGTWESLIKAAGHDIPQREGVDYHVIRVRPGGQVPEHWLRGGTKADVVRYIANFGYQEHYRTKEWLAGFPLSAYGQAIWVVVPGPEPRAEWGEVCY